MDLQTMTNVLVAMTTAHAMHSVLEPWGIHSKVTRLDAYIQGKPVKESPVKVNTRSKALSAGYGLFVVAFLFSYFVTTLMKIEATTAITISVGLIVFIELVNTFTIDSYHVRIEKITKKFKHTSS